MAKRKSISKKIRFEVFKRDSFTCQYCGKSAPDIILQIDHLSPVSKGGNNDVFNLITSCQECNSGKSNTLLDDDSVIQKQRRQLAELNERREQLEMMLAWREGLKSVDNLEVNAFCDAWKKAMNNCLELNELGISNAKKLIKKHGLQKCLDVLDDVVDKYLVYDDNGSPVKESAEFALTKLGGYLSMMSRPEHEREIYYIRGILRSRLNYIKDDVCLRMLREAYEFGVSIEELKDIARSVRNWTELNSVLYKRIGWYE